MLASCQNLGLIQGLTETQTRYVHHVSADWAVFMPTGFSLDVLIWTAVEKEDRIDVLLKVYLFLCLLVDQEEHPHAVCQRRRRRPRSSASQGGLMLTTSWCEGGSVTAGKSLTLRVGGVGAVMGWVRLGSNAQPPQVRLICWHRRLMTCRSDAKQLLNFLLRGRKVVKRLDSAGLVSSLWTRRADCLNLGSFWMNCMISFDFY